MPIWTPPDYGAYLVAIQDYQANSGDITFRQHELAVVFSRLKNQQIAQIPLTFDLFFEKGNILFAINDEIIRHYFMSVHEDPYFVIDGCSTNPGWNAARASLKKALT